MVSASPARLHAQSDSLVPGPPPAPSPQDAISQRFTSAGRVPIVGMSSLHGNGAEKVMDAVCKSYERWNKR